MPRKKDQTFLVAPVDTENTRTLQEKKVLTEDALKWSKNRLEKALKARIQQAEIACGSARIALTEPLKVYIAEVDRLTSTHMRVVSDDSLWSVTHINRIAQHDGGTPGVNTGMKGEFVLTYCKHSISSANGNHLIQVKHHPSKEKMFLLGFVQRLGDDIRAMAEANDFTAPLEFTAEFRLWDLDETDSDDYPTFKKDFSMSAEISGELITLRRGLVPLYEAVAAADHALELAKGDLEKLDENIEELEMQAIETRIREAGGEDILSTMQAGIQSLLTSGSFNASPTLIGDAGPERDGA